MLKDILQQKEVVSFWLVSITNLLRNGIIQLSKAIRENIDDFFVIIMIIVRNL